METQSDQSSSQSSDRGSSSSGSSGDSGRGDAGLEVEHPERGEPNQSVQPNRSEAPNLPNKSEQLESREPKPGQSEMPKEGPNKSEQLESREPKPGQSEMPKPEPNRTDSEKTVLMTHPINDGKSHPGRGATGKDGHGLDKHPDAKDWYNKAAHDLKADAGTKVQAPMGGKVTVDRDTSAKHEGDHFGDTITISNGDFKVVLMHVDARPGLETEGKPVKPGEQIGQVTHWDSNPGETHLHVATATKGSDGAFHGVDPGSMLSATQGGNGREVTNVGDGRYVVGDQKYTMPAAPPERSSQSGRENDQSCTSR